MSFFKGSDRVWAFEFDIQELNITYYVLRYIALKHKVNWVYKAWSLGFYDDFPMFVRSDTPYLITVAKAFSTWIADKNVHNAYTTREHTRLSVIVLSIY